MLAGKILFQAIKYQNQLHNHHKVGSLFKLNLVINEIFYDQLKQFHTKYLCVTMSDLLTLELFDNATQVLIGTTNIYEIYKLIQEERTIQVKINNSQTIGDILLVLSFQPVAAFQKKKTVSPSKRKIDQITKSPSVSPRKLETYLQKQNLNLIKEESEENEYNSNQNRFQTNKQRSSAFDSSQKIQRSESQTIQTLAQQREKILGQLFGKFKRQR